MENHPIPQDVTGFKFKLIGSVTIKQFFYLLITSILSFFILVSPLFFLIKFPLLFFFITLGIGLAFVPIDGRPMDKMIFYFLKTIPSENQYIYRKKGAVFFSELEMVHAPVKEISPEKNIKAEEKLKKDLLLNRLKGSYFDQKDTETSFLDRVVKPFFEEPEIEKPPKKEKSETLTVQTKNTLDTGEIYKGLTALEEEFKQAQKEIKTETAIPAATFFINKTLLKDNKEEVAKKPQSKETEQDMQAESKTLLPNKKVKKRAWWNIFALIFGKSEKQDKKQKEIKTQPPVITNIQNHLPKNENKVENKTIQKKESENAIKTFSQKGEKKQILEKPTIKGLSFWDTIKMLFKPDAPATHTPTEKVKEIQSEKHKESMPPQKEKTEASVITTTSPITIQKNDEQKEKADIEKANTLLEKEKHIQTLEGQLEELALERESLQKRLIEFAKNKPPEKVYKPSEGKIIEETQTVKKVNPQSGVSAGFPILPDIPNIVLGIIKDPRGKVLPNVLVEVVDKDNNPVRAFKTNQLGQFASATPLTNGTYIISFTDSQKQHEFDNIEIELKGEIFSPLEITSIDAREKLRRELFENKSD